MESAKKFPEGKKDHRWYLFDVSIDTVEMKQRANGYFCVQFLDKKTSVISLLLSK